MLRRQRLLHQGLTNQPQYCSFRKKKTIQENDKEQSTVQLRDVHICETGPRDGLQNLPTFVPTAAKCVLIDAIAASGVPEIDAGSFVPPKVVPQFADVDAVVARALTHRGSMTGALVPNPKGAERAIAAGAHTIYFVISASTTHNLANVRRTIEEQIEGFAAV